MKNPNAKALALPKLPRADSGAAASGAAGRARSTSAAPAGSQAAGSQGDDGAGAAVAPKRAPAKRKAAVAAEAEAELVADEELPPRTADMPVRLRPQCPPALTACLLTVPPCLPANLRNMQRLASMLLLLPGSSAQSADCLTH